jgi:MinD-like ATPase involved in chromosome partitioning or flagellar assembly
VVRSKIATVAGEPELEARLASLLSERRDAELYMRCMDRVEVLAAIRGGGIEVLISAGAPPWLDRQCATEALDRGVRFVGLFRSAAEASALSKLGATLVDADLEDALLTEEMLFGAEPAPIQAGSPREQGRLISVWGPKGAPGRTTVAIELAVACAFRSPGTLLIDADPSGGDILQRLGIADELSTVVWAARMAAKDELDTGFLTSELRRAGPRGPIVLPGLPRSDLWPEVSDFGWRELMNVARSHFAFSVLDCGASFEPSPGFDPVGSPGRDHMTLSALDAADVVVAVVKADPIGLKNFVWAYEQLKERVPAEDVWVVANRVPAAQERAVIDFLKRQTGKRPVVCLPDRPGELSRSLLLGRAIGERTPGSPFSVVMQELAGRLGAEVPKRGLLTRISGRR